mgnify:CR=1 FL=1
MAAGKQSTKLTEIIIIAGEAVYEWNQELSGETWRRRAGGLD